MPVSIGQIYRDTYYDGHNERAVHRTIRIVEVCGEYVRAETITDCLGAPSTRKTRLSLKTLASGYVLVEA